ncbi:hypothetical protein EVAR_84209_1 [Eumeta japonica]|uniref:Uncharacterized protein n=1 Tax=Eumeta variegata TaxID=151549 RepID=A0A4C1SAX9_EUMVA|nr:hypothetical protein EVAR_84209_1 [Eumeta japonica]
MNGEDQLGWRNTPPRSDHRQKLTFIPHVAKACKRLLIFTRLSPSGQGDVGSESEIVRTIYYRDRAYRSVRFVRLGTGDEEARRAKMLDAVQRSVALKACRAHRTVPCIPRSSSRGCSPDIE